MNFQWPSLLYAADITAWDLFLGLSLLFAAPVFAGARDRWVRRGLFASGGLCLLGLVGPAVDVLAWRGIGIFGYGVVFPMTCLAISRAFVSRVRPPDLPVDADASQAPARWAAAEVPPSGR